MLANELGFTYQDVSRGDTAAVEKIFARRADDVTPYTSFFDNRADKDAQLLPNFIRVKQEAAKVSAQNFGVKRTTVSLVQEKILPTPKGTDKFQETFKISTSIPVGVTEDDVDGAIAKFRAFVASNTFVDVVKAQER